MPCQGTRLVKFKLNLILTNPELLLSTELATISNWQEISMLKKQFLISPGVF